MDTNKLGYADLLRHAAYEGVNVAHGIEPLYSEAEIAEYALKFATPSELKAAYDAAPERDGLSALIRGVLFGVEYSSADLLHKSVSFRPDANGDTELWCEPWFGADGEMHDLVWLDYPNNEWGFSTGVSDLLGRDQLTSKVYSQSDPLAVTDCPLVWADEGRKGVCLIRKSDRDELRKAAVIQCDTFELAELIAGDHFPDDSERVLCPNDPYSLVLHLQEIASAAMRRTVAELTYETPFEYLERRRIERGGLPGEPLPAELTGVAL